MVSRDIAIPVSAAEGVLFYGKRIGFKNSTKVQKDNDQIESHFAQRSTNLGQ